MQTRCCEFYSDGIRVDALLQLPDARPEEHLPAIVLCSGFQGLKELIPGKLWQPLTDVGFACLAFDYRGFGTSDGARGRVLPVEQVEDVRSALTFLEEQPEVDPRRLGLLGWGLGGGVVIQAAAEDARAGAVACLNGVGDAGRAVRDSRTYAEWMGMQDRIAADRRTRVLTGHSELVSPWDVVPLEPVTKANVDEDMYGRHERFALDRVSLLSADAYYNFRPELMVDRISPRPLMIVHGARDRLHPVDEARKLYNLAKEPKRLIEIAEGDHLNWIQPDHPLFQTAIPQVIDWFKHNLAAPRRG